MHKYFSKLSIHNTRPIHALVLLGLIVTSNCWAQIYKTVDEYGQVTYTDQPPQNEKSEEVDLPHLNTEPAAKTRQTATTHTNTPTQHKSYSLRITSPREKAKIAPSTTYLGVQASLTPNVVEGLSVQWFVDGEKNGKPKKSLVSSVYLDPATRGERAIQAKLIDDESGKVIASSARVSIFVFRPPKKAAPK